jgi:hypothetical protein
VHRRHYGGKFTIGVNLPLVSTTPVVTTQPSPRFSLIALTLAANLPPVTAIRHRGKFATVNDEGGDLPLVSMTPVFNNDKHYRIVYTCI